MARAQARLRDWIFGAPGKRRILEALVSDERRTWSQVELARAAEMHPKGSADEHLLALVQIGLVAEETGRYRLESNHPLTEPLRRLLGALAQIPDAPVRRPGQQ